MGYLPRFHILVVFVLIIIVVIVLVEIVVFVRIIVEIVVLEKEVIHNWRQIETLHDVGSAGFSFSRFGGGYVDQK